MLLVLTIRISVIEYLFINFTNMANLSYGFWLTIPFCAAPSTLHQGHFATIPRIRRAWSNAQENEMHNSCFGWKWSHWRKTQNTKWQMSKGERWGNVSKLIQCEVTIYSRMVLYWNLITHIFIQIHNRYQTWIPLMEYHLFYYFQNCYGSCLKHSQLSWQNWRFGTGLSHRTDTLQ